MRSHVRSLCWIPGRTDAKIQPASRTGDRYVDRKSSFADRAGNQRLFSLFRWRLGAHRIVFSLLSRCIFLLYLLEYSEVLVGQLLLVSAAVEEKEAVVGTIEIRTKSYGLVELADGILVFFLVLVEDAEFVMGFVEG